MEWQLAYWIKEPKGQKHGDGRQGYIYWQYCNAGWKMHAKKTVLVPMMVYPDGGQSCRPTPTNQNERKKNYIHNVFTLTNWVGHFILTTLQNQGVKITLVVSTLYSCMVFILGSSPILTPLVRGGSRVLKKGEAHGKKGVEHAAQKGEIKNVW